MTDTDLLTTYRECFATPDEHPTGNWGFLCSICQRPVDDGPCPEHAPREIPGLQLVECAAEPRHWLWVHARDDYGTPCYVCLHNEAAERERQARQCRHWGWRRWKITHKLTMWLYALGATSTGGGWEHGDGHEGCLPDGSLRFRGSRPYVLGASRNTWRCWFNGHRRGENVGFGFCGKCVPWPCCGSTVEAHNAGCLAADPPATFDASVPPGGFVCAVPDADRPGGICGMPVESEPCTEHSPKRGQP